MKAPRTLDALLAQIEQLQAEADALRDKERANVIQQCVAAIRNYSITLPELRQVMRNRAAKPPPVVHPNPEDDDGVAEWVKSVRKPKPVKKVPGTTELGKLMSATVRYTDGKNVWSGYGKQPLWVRDFLLKSNRRKLSMLLSPDFDPEAFKDALRKAKAADRAAREGV